jgi:hypothetical protein
MKVAAQIAEMRLRKIRDKFERNWLHDELATYYARYGKWERAEHHWSMIHLTEFDGAEAVLHRVELKMANTVKSARAHLRELDDLASSGKMRLCNKRSVEQARLKLRIYIEAAERVMPPRRQRAYGLSVDRNGGRSVGTVRR